MDTIYSTVSGTRQGKPWMGMVNLGFRNYKEKHKFPWFLRLTLILKDVHNNFPSKKEQDDLNSFEDEFEKHIKELTKSFFLGRITWNGLREIFFYVSEPQKVHSYLQSSIESKRYSWEFEYSIIKDENWNETIKYFNIQN